jgi:hypothetical protein
VCVCVCVVCAVGRGGCHAQGVGGGMLQVRVGGGGICVCGGIRIQMRQYLYICTSKCVNICTVVPVNVMRGSTSKCNAGLTCVRREWNACVGSEWKASTALRTCGKPEDTYIRQHASYVSICQHTSSVCGEGVESVNRNPHTTEAAGYKARTR